jgi:cholest-4-en-3-one 26-monooxygenase
VVRPRQPSRDISLKGATCSIPQTHFRLGNQLARLERTLMTRRLLEHLPDLRLASGDPLPLRAANFVSGLEKMPVIFTHGKPVR